MKTLVAFACLGLISPELTAQPPSGGAGSSPSVTLARGTFDVRTTSLPADEGLPFGRWLLDKTFHGDLTGTSKALMTGSMSKVEGSAGYVAMEEITGSLQGRKGSFVLQHSGSMHKGAMTLNITVVPDSGTDELAGLGGTMKILIEGKKHVYEFEYTLGR